MNDGGRSPEERERARIEREQRRLGEGRVEQKPRAERLDAALPNGPPPPARPRTARARGRRRLLALAAVLLSGLWLFNAFFQPLADGAGEGTVIVTIPRGAGVGDVGDALARNDVVPSGRFFGWRARFSGKSDRFKAGRYRLAHEMSYSAVIDALVEGPNIAPTTITIIEGRSRYEIAEQLNGTPVSGDYMAATKSSKSLNPRRYGAPPAVKDLEGFLFPATYDLRSGATASDLVSQQLKAFKRSFAQVDMGYARAKNLTPFDVITIASLIEREVSVASERRIVAAVIYNRLRQGIALGIDASTRFAARNWTRPLTSAELADASPYNTRKHQGLPPGPIGNPGLASLRAAARPARVGYLFYVADPCKPGRHAFSSTDAEFQADVRRYQLARAKAGGKAPRGC